MKDKSIFYPTDFEKRVSGPLCVLHPSVRRRKADLVATVALAMLLAAILGLCSASVIGAWKLFFASESGYDKFSFSGAFKTTFVLLTPLLSYFSIVFMAVCGETAAMKYFKERAKKELKHVENLMPEKPLKRLIAEQRPEFSEMRRIYILRLAEIDRVHRTAKRSLGLADTNPAEQARQSALWALSSKADADWKDLDRTLRERDEARAGSTIEAMQADLVQAAQIGSTSARNMKPKIAETGNARFNRLVQNAEAALEINPDLVDAGGARIDALIRIHLPRLLKVHTEASNRAHLQDAALVMRTLDQADALLDEGVEAVRSSLAEALKGLQHETADSLLAEVTFLKSRRGHDTPLLAS